MEEQLVSFDTAKLAKEKGFNYMKSNCYGDNMAYNLDDPTAIPACKANVVIGYILAPTQSLLQKWLWEKHKIFLSLSGSFYISGGDPKCDGFRCYIINFNNGETDSVPRDSKLKETPEEALELGLQEALKLIK